MPKRHSSLSSGGNRCVCTSVTGVELTIASTSARSRSSSVSNTDWISVDVAIDFYASGSAAGCEAGLSPAGTWQQTYGGAEPHLTSSGVAALERDLEYTRIVWVGPAIVRNRWRPTGPQRILVVRIRAKSNIQLAIFSNFVAIQLNTQTGRGGYRYRSRFVFQLPACDDVVRQMMI